MNLLAFEGSGWGLEDTLIVLAIWMNGPDDRYYDSEFW